MNNFNISNYLQEIRNKYGSFQVSIHYQDGKWGKWFDVLEIWEWKTTNEKIWEYLSKINNRTSFETEIRIDLDPPNNTKEKVKEIIQKLRDYELNTNYKIFFSGSRGYHIHIIEPELALISNRYEREKKKRFLLRKLGADEQLASEKHMLALEYVPHWKTGILKKEVEINELGET